MTPLVLTRLLIVVCAISLPPVVQASQQTTIENELDAAKILYRDGRLDEAIGALRMVIAKLNELRDVQIRRLPLAEAHFHLGLAYLAMRDESAAIENFRQVAALDPDRVLDPEIYSPRVIGVFERARSDVVRTLGPKPADQPLEGRGPPSVTVARPSRRGETLKQVLPGTKLRVGRTGSLFGVEGQLIAIDDTVLTVGAQNWRLDVPRETLTRIEIVTARKNHWLAGMVTGAGLGVLIGALETPGCGGNDGDCYTRGENMGYGGLGLGLVGGLIGALYRTDQWAELPLDRVSSRTAARRGPGLFFTWRY
jgi:tetratricopeptide repeat protein